MELFRNRSGHHEQIGTVHAWPTELRTKRKFDPETEFYSKYEREIKLGANVCMASASVPSQDGSTKSFPGLLWPDQTSGGQGRVNKFALRLPDKIC